jgi:SAM-dependent methyltransferase
MTVVMARTHSAPPISQEESASHPPGTASAPNFNHLAGIYRWLEYLTFGPFLWRCRVHFLPELAHCRRALILGDGDGRFTAHLLRENPHLEVTAIDGSPRMIESLRRTSASNAVRLATEVADLRTWKPADLAEYDLVVTHFSLDCLTSREVRDLANRLTPAIVPNALWLVSEFAIPPTVFGRTVAAPLVWLLYRAFRLIANLRQRSLPDHGVALAECGWSLHLENTYLKGLLLSQLWRRRPSASESRLPSGASTEKKGLRPTGWAGSTVAAGAHRAP